jgi:bifunctional DNase/RNase
MRQNYSIKILVVALIASIIILAYYYILPEIILLPKLSVSGFIPVSIGVQSTDEGGVITLNANCSQLIATVELSQAVSIYNGMNKVVGPRPNSHDLFKDVLNTLGVEIIMVKIVEMKDEMYFSKIVMKKGNTLLNLDARPSDAIAIAARVPYEVPIYVNETLFKQNSKKIC